MAEKRIKGISSDVFNYQFDTEKKGYKNRLNEDGFPTWTRGNVQYSYENPCAREMEFGRCRISRTNLSTGETRRANDREVTRFVKRDENGDARLNPFGNKYWKG